MKGARVKGAGSLKSMREITSGPVLARRGGAYLELFRLACYQGRLDNEAALWERHIESVESRLDEVDNRLRSVGRQIETLYYHAHPSSAPSTLSQGGQATSGRATRKARGSSEAGVQSTTAVAQESLRAESPASPQTAAGSHMGALGFNPLKLSRADISNAALADTSGTKSRRQVCFEY